MNRYLLTITKDSYLLPLIPLLAVFTFLCARSGLDAAINDLARLQNEYFSIVWSAPPLLIGIVAPLLIPLILLSINRDLGILVAKTVVFTLIVVSILKGLTSRVHPEDLSIIDTYLRSNSFKFGFLANGLLSVVEGWPSGHCATNTAMVLSAVSRSSSKVKIVGAIWAIWVTLATVLGINGDVHWFSDSMAGLAIGVMIALAHIKNNPLKNLIDNKQEI